MPWPAWNRPLVVLPVFGTSVPIATVVFGPSNWPVSGFSAWRFVPVHGLTPLRSRRRTAPAPCRRRPLVGEEVRRLAELVVLRLLVHEAHAVVERQLAGHLPVVLHVAFGVVVDVLPFDVPASLVVGAETRRARRWRSRSRCRAGCWCRCAKLMRADGAALALLRLVAVRVVEAGLERVPAADLGQADRRRRWSC